ncbi:MAG: MotA/TolQ/ExbB proton channel family protein [Gammaproteobacteria bacterium]|nr:MAG: MotA/TolQ/ExbB proton channel family protein [Gammaproteobacteria bacterium]
MYWLYEHYEGVRAFLQAGGTVLYMIAILTFWMWTLVFERIWYFRFSLKKDIAAAMNIWESRPERKSWNARQIRRSLISQIDEQIQQNMSIVKAIVALCPLMGLLGTVTGMIQVFNIMAVTGGGEARAMASGVSMATIPTMAGMVAALSGVFANTYITRVAERESALFADHLTTDH